MNFASALVLVGVVLGGADAGTAPRAGTATLTLSRVAFDGRELRGLATICAETDGVFVYDDLGDNHSLEVQSATDCATGTKVGTAIADYFGTVRPKVMLVRRGFCFGRYFSWRVKMLPSPSRSGCTEIEAVARIRNEKGDVVETISSTVRVQP